MSKSAPLKQHTDARFTLRHRQPRADKLDAKQRAICRVDDAYTAALQARVSDPARFAAFIAGNPSYTNVGRLCPTCGSYRRRTRDRSCYMCHLAGGGENFERMKAGISPVVTRSRDSHLDLLERKRAEADGNFNLREFDGLIAKRWPTGRLEITLPNGEHKMDFSVLTYQEIQNGINHYPQLREALDWAGWS